MVPPFGWRVPRDYPEVNNQWIEADTYGNLITKLTNFRIDNKIELGNPEKDIEDYVCTNFPRHCYVTPGSSGILPEQSEPPKNLRERITSWANKLYARVGAIEFVDQSEADRRALICSTCPKNTEWRNGCPPCVAATNRTLVLIRQGKNTKTYLGGCQVAGHDNSTACFLISKDLKERNFMYPRFSNELPSNCWIK